MYYQLELNDHICSYYFDKQKIKQIDDFLSVVVFLKKEMAEQVSSLWVLLMTWQTSFDCKISFGLHPSAIDAVIHQNHPSKVEEYDNTCLQLLTG
jgi:hypothetical protein